MWKKITAWFKSLDTFYSRVTLPLLGFLYFYILLIIRTGLLFQEQKPVFFLNFSMVVNYIKYPGGLVDYLALIAGQAYYFSVTGAIVLTIFCWMSAWLTYLVLRTITGKHPQTMLVLAPALLIVASTSHYDFPLATVLAWLITMAGFLIYLKTAHLGRWLHILLGLLIATVLYYVVCGMVWIYIVYIWFHQFLIDKKYIKALINLLIIPIPFLASFLLFKIDLYKAFLYHLLPEAGKHLWTTPVILYAYFLVLLVYIGIARRDDKDESENVLHINNKWARLITQIVLVFGTSYVTFVFSSPLHERPQIAMAYNIQRGNWNKVLDLQYTHRFQSNYLVCASNRALYHSGDLLNDLFSYPQKRGDVSLFLPGRADGYDPLFKSRLFYDLGFMDESLNWCFESITRHGETPWNLKQLATIQMANQDTLAASTTLHKLKHTLLFWNWANRYNRVIRNDSLYQSDPLFQDKIPAKAAPQLDHFFDNPQQHLEALFELDPDNRMVFEYLMAYYLFTWNFEGIVKQIPYFEKYNRYRLPRHIQEALVLYNDQEPFPMGYLEGLRISKKLDARYITYRKLLAIHRIKKVDAAKKLHNSFGNTFWYYAVFPTTDAIDYDQLEEQVEKAIRDKEDMLKNLVREYEERSR